MGDVEPYAWPYGHRRFRRESDRDRKLSSLTLVGGAQSMMVIGRGRGWRERAGLRAVWGPPGLGFAHKVRRFSHGFTLEVETGPVGRPRPRWRGPPPRTFVGATCPRPPSRPHPGAPTDGSQRFGPEVN